MRLKKLLEGVNVLLNKAAREEVVMKGLMVSLVSSNNEEKICHLVRRGWLAQMLIPPPWARNS